MVTHLSITIRPETEKKIREMSDKQRISMNQICGEILEKNIGLQNFSPSEYLRHRGFSS